MSDHYVFSFAFELRRDVDGRVLRIFEALAQGNTPQPTDLAALPKVLSQQFGTVDTLRGHHSTVGSPVSIWTRELRAMDGRPILQRQLNLSLVMHDDWYADGGWVLPFSLFDIVGEDGLFGQHRTEEGRRLTQYHRRGADLVVLGIDVTDRPGEPFAATISSTTIVSPAERTEFLRQANGIWPG